VEQTRKEDQRMDNEKGELGFSDRYKALGIPYPDPITMCQGQCEGTGRVPVYKDETDAQYRKLWLEAEAIHPSSDGWHFVTCPDCGGSGKNEE